MGHLEQLHQLIERQMLNGLLLEWEYNQAIQSLKTVWEFCSINATPKAFPTVLIWKSYPIPSAIFEARELVIRSELVRIIKFRDIL